MRRIAIFTLGICLCISSFVQAQYAVVKNESVSESAPLLSDILKPIPVQRTADTASSNIPKTQTIKIPGVIDHVTIQAFATKVSGTSGGKIYLLGSVNGTQFARAGGLDSLTIYNVAQEQSATFRLTPSPFTFYRIQFVGTGTHTTRFNSIALYRRK